MEPWGHTGKHGKEICKSHNQDLGAQYLLASLKANPRVMPPSGTAGSRCQMWGHPECFSLSLSPWCLLCADCNLRHFLALLCPCLSGWVPSDANTEARIPMRGSLGEVAPENSGRRVGSEREGAAGVLTSRIPLWASDVQPQWDPLRHCRPHPLRQGGGGGDCRSKYSPHVLFQQQGDGVLILQPHPLWAEGCFQEGELHSTSVRPTHGL